MSAKASFPPSVVSVEVGIDDETDLLIGNLPDPPDDALDQSLDLVVHEENPVGTGQDPDVPPTAGRVLEHVNVSLNGNDLHSDHVRTLSSHGRGDQGLGHKCQQEKGKKGERRSCWARRRLHGRSECNKGKGIVAVYLNLSAGSLAGNQDVPARG